uniref:Uncharacterized protein n=1 Tax=Tetradesmus obliquus TaxID=3088 RepID=A0A383W0Q5_TETOB
MRRSPSALAAPAPARQPSCLAKAGKQRCSCWQSDSTVDTLSHALEDAHDSCTPQPCSATSGGHQLLCLTSLQPSQLIICNRSSPVGQQRSKQHAAAAGLSQAATAAQAIIQTTASTVHWQRLRQQGSSTYLQLAGWRCGMGQVHGSAACAAELDWC